MIFIRENFMIVFVWIFAITVSTVSFVAITNTTPGIGEFLLGHTLYSILAMPNSFLNMVGLYSSNSPQTNYFFYLLAFGYWGVVGAAHYWYFEEREPQYVLAIAFLLLTASVKWLYFAIIMMRSYVPN